MAGEPPPSDVNAPRLPAGLWLAAVAVDGLFGLFYTLGGLAMTLAGDQIASDAEEAAENLHTGWIYLLVGLVLLCTGVLLATRKSWSFAPGVWLNSLGVVTELFMFARTAILRATAPVSEGQARLPMVTGQMIVVMLVQTALFALAIYACMRLQRWSLEAIARQAAESTASGDAILPPGRLRS